MQPAVIWRKRTPLGYQASQTVVQVMRFDEISLSANSFYFTAITAYACLCPRGDLTSVHFSTFIRAADISQQIQPRV